MMSEAEKLYAWLETQKSEPPSAKEKLRMQKAIEFDLQQWEKQGK